MCSSDLGRNPAAFPAVESQSCGSGASGSCRPAPDASGEEAAARHREQIAGKDNRMSDTTLARAAFDARLHELKLHDLVSHEIDRLWKSRLKQLEISARLDSHLDPTLEAAVAFSLTRNNPRSEAHTSELQSLMRISYAVFCL